MKMSITRALSELKLLDARINRAISESRFVAIQEGGKLLDGHIKVEDFSTNAESSIDSIEALIARRNEIKSNIVQSNAKTPIVFPSKKEYTVAGVIERKSSISYDRAYLYQMRQQYTTVLRQLENANNNFNNQLEKRIENILGKGDALKGKDEEIKQLTDSFKKDSQPKLIDPVALKSLIDKLHSDIEEFEQECDFLLSESNTRTDIEVSD